MCHKVPQNVSHPLPGLLGLVMAPITASVASVAFSGSDSNHRLRIYDAKQQLVRHQKEINGKLSACYNKPLLLVRLQSHKSLERLCPVSDLQIQKQDINCLQNFKHSAFTWKKKKEMYMANQLSQTRIHRRTTFDKGHQGFRCSQPPPQWSSRDARNVCRGSVQERLDSCC